MTIPMLFSPLQIRGLTLKNRVVVAPMHQYSAVEGFATDWHLVNAGRFAQGGAGLVIMGANLLPLPWARLSYNRDVEAYQLDITDEELKRAPSFMADKDFDWGDRTQEEELHRYYGVPPYWGGF